MTPEIFLDRLVSDLTVLLSDCLLPTKTGARRAPKVYMHDLPVPQMDDEDEDADAEDVTAPFVIVRATGGTFDDWSDLHHVGVAIIICTYDDTPDRQGTSDVLGVIERIYHRFARCPALGIAGRNRHLSAVFLCDGYGVQLSGCEDRRPINIM